MGATRTGLGVVASRIAAQHDLPDDGAISRERGGLHQVITVRLEALEFMDAVPVVGANVDLTVRVAPRFSERVELPDTDDRPGTGELGGGPGITPRTIALAPGGATSTVFVPRYELG